MNKEILNKYLDNSSSQLEFEEFTKWVNTESLQKEGRELGFADWSSFEPKAELPDNQKYNRLLDKIHHEINLKEYNGEKGKYLILKKTVNWFSKVAAILILPLLGVLLYLIADHNFQPGMFAENTIDTLEVIAPIGSRTVVQLTDGTEVNLNYGSRIKYPREFTGDKREIELIGEGYFDVAHNPDKPFIVKTGKLNIKVLGTEFNVQAYPGEDNVATTLVNGKVKLEELDADGNAKPIGAMEPGQHVNYHLNTGEIESFSGNIEKYVSWKEGKLIFDNEPITEVTSQLSRMFNVDILVADDVKELTYTVTLLDEPLFFILDLMTETTPVTYSVSRRKKLSDGTYTKQQIRIERRK
ncbi:FecR domain-containing protein [uncultured Draconibacterium sp.]|uniref:FecR family protein n=1 Tax=uncultured Draconibacterium sp. TaxID=1573823 RepID=UPI003217A810